MLKKGQTNNKAGRPPGVPNRSTADVRAAIAMLATRNVDKLQAWLDRIAETDPDKAYKLFMDTLEYHIPKLSRAEISAEVEQKVTITADGDQDIIKRYIASNPHLREEACTNTPMKH